MSKPGSDTEDWQRAYAILDELLDLSYEKRLEALESMGLDERLAHRVRSLLKEAERDPGPLDRPLRLNPGSLEGTTLGHYAIEAEIGRGGSSVVYRAQRTDVDFERPVALKVLTVGQMAAGALERFQREQEILAKLQHPNIVGLLDAGIFEDGTAYLAMPLVDGEPIDRYCDSRDLDARERVKLFLSAVDAIAFAQKNLVVHRDIKPANVLIADGNSAVLDFGIAKLIDEGVSDEHTSTRLLTPSFGAPEQWSGAPVTTATDVYGIGATLYLLLCGEPPDRETPLRPSTRRDAVPGCDRDLDNVVMKALQPEPERRYDGAAALGDDLRRWLDGRAVQATPDSLSYRVRTYVRRNRPTVVAASLAIVALLSGTAIATWQAIEARQQAETAEAAIQFLIESFESADPYSEDEELTARDIVARGVERIDEALESQSQARRRMRLVLAELSYVLGDYQRAGELFEQSLTSELPVADRIEAHVSYGMSLSALARHDDADVQFQEAFTVADKEGVDLALRAYIATQHTSHLLESGRYSVAIEQLTDFLGDSQLLSEISDQSVYALHGNMASASQSAGLLDQALAHVRRMLELEERVELSQQDRADGYRMAAGVFEAKGDLAAAEKYERQAYELSLGRLGAEDRRTLVSQNNLALIQKNRGDFAGSAATLTEVVDAQKRALGADHADVGASLFNLAESLLHQGQVQTALEHYRESNRIMELHFPGSARLAVNYVIYGRALGKAGEEEAAEFEFDRGLALAPGGDPLHPLTARLRVEHAAFLNDLGRSAEALPQLVEPTAKILETYGDTSREYALALLQRGRALVRGGDQERGRAALTRSREILESSPHRGRYRAEIEQARGLLAQ